MRAKVSVRWEISKEKDVFLHLHCGFSFQSTVFSEGTHGLSVPPAGILLLHNYRPLGKEQMSLREETNVPSRRDKRPIGKGRKLRTVGDCWDVR